MEFHRMFRLTLTLLFCGGIYLPSMRKVVKNKYLIVASKFFGKLLPPGALVYITSVMIPVFDPEVKILDKVLNCLVSMVTFSIVVKSLLMNRDILKMESLIETWDEMSKEMNELYPNLGEKMLLKRKKITDIWSIVFGSLITGVLISTSLIPFYSRKLEHPTAMPTTAASPQFEILCLFELIMGSSLCYLTNAYNCFRMQMVAFEHVLCTYLTQTLEIFMRGVSISEEGNMTYNSNYYPPGNGVMKVMSYDDICAHVDKKLRMWINLHQKLIRFNGLIQDIYTIPLLLDYIGLILIVAVVAFLVVSGSLNAALIFDTAAYTVTVYTIFYVTCYYGDLVEFTSENLFRDAFDQCWYAYPRKIRSAYLFIMMRCRKPLTLKALSVYPLDSRSFGLIFNHSYSFLMFLLQVSNRGK